MQRCLESSRVRIKAVLTQGTRGVAGSRQRYVLTPQRCPEGTIFTITSSSLLEHPGDTEYIHSVEGPGLSVVEGLLWFRLLWGPSATPLRTSQVLWDPGPPSRHPPGC